MTNYIILSKKDGRGIVQLNRALLGDADRFHIADAFGLDETGISINSRGQVTIPRRIMEQYGTLRPDGRRALALDFGGRYDAGERTIGANIIQNKKLRKFLETANTGDRIPKKLLEKVRGDTRGTNLIKPSDTADLYTGSQRGKKR